MNQEALQEIVRTAIANKLSDDADLRRLKRVIASKYRMEIVSNADILSVYRQMIAAHSVPVDEKLLHLFSKRKIRSLSGVAVITVLTKPYFCPGRCVYCPTEARMPKSYLANEPGAARALRNNFDPFQQVSSRLATLAHNGHPTDKCELIVLGGTWSAYPKRYQTWFLKRCFEAFNASSSTTFDAAKHKNETAPHRVIGLTLETRPDHVTRAEIRRLRWLGCTRVQLGVQTTDQTILDLIKRDQTNQQVIDATRLLKEAGMKISHHYMQGLPGATLDKDVQTIRDAFQTPDYQPDHVKIYPTVVLKSAILYRWWKQGKYVPYTPEELVQLLIAIKKLVPPWVRIERVIRDIPSDSIEAGNTQTNLRQMMHREGVQCQCIRCREPHDAHVNMEDAVMVTRTYDASDGKEYFISFESRDHTTIFAFTRLRLQRRRKHWMPVLQDAAIIREIHTYGKLQRIHAGKGAVQHGGFGRTLMGEAERIARQEGFLKMAVIAGVGVREYFRTLGYTLQDEYMIKTIQ